MQWASTAEFFAMGGYALYVWGAYGVCALVIGAEAALLVRRARTSRANAGRMTRGDSSK